MVVESKLQTEPVRNRKERIRLAVHTVFALAIWGVSGRLPLRWASAFGGAVAVYLLGLLPYMRHLETNIRIAFPEMGDDERKRLAQRMLWNIGRTFAEYPHLGEITDPSKSCIQINGWDIYEAIRAEGRPIIFVSGHMANWEITAGSGARRNMPVTVVYAPRRGEWLDRRLQGYRRQMCCELTPRGGAARPLVQRLMHKECIGIIVDQRTDDGIMVPFFGIPAPTTPAPARLAIKFNAAIVPVECRRLDGPKFEVTYHAPIRPEDYAQSDDPVFAITEQMNRHLEQWIRAHPQDWLCRRRRWKKSRPVAIENN